MDSTHRSEGSIDGLDAGMRAMFDQMLEGIQLIDADFRYRYVNETAARHGHRRPDELIGQRMEELFPGIEHTPMFSDLSSCMRDRTARRLMNEFAYPDGNTGWFDLHMAPVPAGVLILSIDVSGQMRAQRDLRRNVAELEAADRRKAELMTMLAHELRNPLAPIRNGLHILGSRASLPEQTVADVTEMIDRQVQHLERFVDDLLDANRISAGELSVQLDRVDLTDVLRGAIAACTSDFDDSGVTLSVELPATPIWVNADAARLEQVFQSVLDNACKFTPVGSVLVQLSGASDTKVAVTIRDTGIGIDADSLSHVFDALFQADTTLERTRGGLGLGLSVAKGIVELHGGTIIAESEGIARGATLRIELPAVAEPAALSADITPSRGTPRKGRVLVIEDNRDSARTLGMILDLWGYQVGVAHSGIDGVDNARDTRPDIVLCDIGLPGMDGYEVARVLRKDEATRGARIIAITGYGRAEDRAKALDAGFDLHFSKPVDPELLRAQLDALTAA